MDKWIKTEALFLDDNDISELTGKESEKILSPYRFDITTIYAYNESEEDDMIVLRFKEGGVITININIVEFDMMIDNYFKETLK